MCNTFAAFKQLFLFIYYSLTLIIMETKNATWKDIVKQVHFVDKTVG